MSAHPSFSHTKTAQSIESPAGEVYEVFAKIKPVARDHAQRATDEERDRVREDKLHHIGNVIAPGVELACVYAFTTYQEYSWAEMVIAPRREIISVIPIR